MTIQSLEGEFDKEFNGYTVFDDNDKVCSRNVFKYFYRQKIEELMLEIVGEDDNPYKYEDTCNQDKADGYNIAKAEIRSKIKEMFEEK